VSLSWVLCFSASHIAFAAAIQLFIFVVSDRSALDCDDKRTEIEAVHEFPAERLPCVIRYRTGRLLPAPGLYRLINADNETVPSSDGKRQ